MSNTSYSMFAVRVSAIEELTPLIKRFTFERTDGLAFPPFSGGSHVLVQMETPHGILSNAYSLMGSLSDLARYQVCVRRDDTGRGGSLFLHQHIQVGSQLMLSEPNNLFPLAEQGERHVLIAGGIGITPFIPMLHELHKRGVTYQLHYAFRSVAHGALWSELQSSPFAAHCFAYIDDENTRLDVSSLFQQLSPETHVYVCGPQSLIDAVLNEGRRLGVADAMLHSEQFSASVPLAGDQAFTVVLKKSGATVHVPADKTMLSVLQDHGIAVECLCREGVCGTCETEIIEGQADHRDQYLDEADKEAQKTMMVCVSRAKGQTITVNL